MAQPAGAVTKHRRCDVGRGGFPEPLLASTLQQADRWRRGYVDGLIREDVLDFERISDLRAMKTLLDLLRTGVGSPVSYQSLAGDLAIAPNTVHKYIEIPESPYITKEGREVDFCLVEEGKPVQLVECELSETHISPNLTLFSKALSVPGVQLSLSLKHERQYSCLNNKSVETLVSPLGPWYVCRRPVTEV